MTILSKRGAPDEPCLVLLAVPPISSVVSKVKSIGCPFVGSIQAAGSFHSRLLGRERLHHAGVPLLDLVRRISCWNLYYIPLAGCWL